MSANHKFDKILIHIYIYIYINRKYFFKNSYDALKIYNSIKMDKGFEQLFLQIRYINGQGAHQKIVTSLAIRKM